MKDFNAFKESITQEILNKWSVSANDKMKENAEEKM